MRQYIVQPKSEVGDLQSVFRMPDGPEYRSHRYLAFGDYDGSGAIERANVKAVAEAIQDRWGDILETRPLPWGKIDVSIPGDPPAGYWERKALYFVRLWVRADVWEAMGLDSLDEYPVWSDEALSEWEWDRLHEHAREAVPYWRDDAPALWCLSADEIADRFVNHVLRWSIGWYGDTPYYDEDQVLDTIRRRARGDGLRRFRAVVAGQYRRFAPRAIRRGRQMTVWDYAEAA